MTHVFAIAVGGALGALARFWSSQWIYILLGKGFPYGTLFVNVVGSLLMGFLYTLLIDRISVGPEWRAAILIGFLGSFTTFSTFSMETINLIGLGEHLKAALNIGLSLALCLVGTAMGIALGRQI